MNGSSRWISPDVSRRRFLQLSSLTGMGIALAACVAPAPADGMQEEPAMEAIELRFQNWFNERRHAYLADWPGSVQDRAARC